MGVNIRMPTNTFAPAPGAGANVFYYLFQLLNNLDQLFTKADRVTL